MEMDWKIPGTVLTKPREEAANLAEQFRAMFLMGGITLSQVCAVTGLDGYIVQNWVKRRFVSPPVSKKYSKNQRVYSESVKSGFAVDQRSLVEYIDPFTSDPVKKHNKNNRLKQLWEIKEN